MPQSRNTRPQSLSDRAYEKLFEMVVRCELEPGEWVTVAALRGVLHTGQTPIHQALVCLEADGFATPHKRRGWQITPLTLKTVSDILDAYRLTALALAELVVRNATDEEINRLHDLMVSWVPGSPAVNGADPGRAPFAYYAEICGNPMMTRTALGLCAHYERVMTFALRQGRMRQEDHVRWRDAAHEALLARDVERAKHAISEVLAVGESEVFRILQGTGSLLSLPLTLNDPSTPSARSSAASASR
jgi:DNA-binding GntR family transcriptional regulator